jgi:hypothetical protein
MRCALRSTILSTALALLPLAPISAGAAAEEGKGVAWTLFGEARFRPEWRDDADLDASADDDLRQGLMRLRIGVDVMVRRDYRIVVQAQDSRVAGEEASTAANERNLDLHQGFLDVTLGEARTFSLRVGRQEWAYGDERLIGPFGWNNVGRSFDGVRARLQRGRATLDGLVARVTTRAAGGGDTGSDLYGVHVRTTPRKGAEYEGYWLGYGDRVGAPGETGAPGDTRVHAIGVRARDRFGRLDVVAEGVLERGEINGDDLEAHAAAAQVGWTPGGASRWRLFAGYDFATGDRDPADGDRQEFFNFFPTNHPHYGYADYEGWRNLKSPYGGVSLARGRHFAQVKAHRFALEEARGAWKDAGGTVFGFDPSGASGRSVGREIDLTYRYSWMEKTLVEAGLSRFTPGRFARLTRGDDPSHWAYVMLLVGF